MLCKLEIMKYIETYNAVDTYPRLANCELLVDESARKEENREVAVSCKTGFSLSRILCLIRGSNNTAI